MNNKFVLNIQYMGIFKRNNKYCWRRKPGTSKRDFGPFSSQKRLLNCSFHYNHQIIHFLNNLEETLLQLLIVLLTLYLMSTNNICSKGSVRKAETRPPENEVKILGNAMVIGHTLRPYFCIVYNRQTRSLERILSEKMFSRLAKYDTKSHGNIKNVIFITYSFSKHFFSRRTGRKNDIINI